MTNVIFLYLLDFILEKLKQNIEDFTIMTVPPSSHEGEKMMLSINRCSRLSHLLLGELRSRKLKDGSAQPRSSRILFLVEEIAAATKDIHSDKPPTEVHDIVTVLIEIVVYLVLKFHLVSPPSNKYDNRTAPLEWAHKVLLIILNNEMLTKIMLTKISQMLTKMQAKERVLVPEEIAEVAALLVSMNTGRWTMISSSFVPNYHWHCHMSDKIRANRFVDLLENFIMQTFESIDDEIDLAMLAEMISRYIQISVNVYGQFTTAHDASADADVSKGVRGLEDEETFKAEKLVVYISPTILRFAFWISNRLQWRIRKYDDIMFENEDASEIESVLRKVQEICTSVSILPMTTKDSTPHDDVKQCVRNIGELASFEIKVANNVFFYSEMATRDVTFNAIEAAFKKYIQCPTKTALLCTKSINEIMRIFMRHMCATTMSKMNRNYTFVILAMTEAVVSFHFEINPGEGVYDWSLNMCDKINLQAAESNFDAKEIIKIFMKALCRVLKARNTQGNSSELNEFRTRIQKEQQTNDLTDMFLTCGRQYL